MVSLKTGVQVHGVLLTGERFILISEVMDASPKRRALSLSDRVAVIRESASKSQRDLAQQYGVEKSTIQGILKRKAEILEAYEVNQSPDRKRVCRRTENEDLDKATHEWFQRVRSQNVPVSGPMLQEKAKQFASKLVITDFKASNRWLNKFKPRHYMAQATVSGEKGSVDGTTVKN